MKRIFLSLLLILATVFSIIAENKTALVIGNGNYSHFSDLANPRREATDMKNALQRMGFEVILLLDGTENQIADALYDFETKLEQRGGIALFHYGGHGVQVKGVNYIIPVDANIPDERRVRANAVDVDEVLAVMDVSGSKTNIVILDACRDNPLPGASRSSSRGLAVVNNPPPDSIIVYAADAGTTAQDGLFTPTLLKYLETPGLKFGDMLRKVRADIIIASGRQQRTGEYNQLISEVYLAGSSSSPVRQMSLEMDEVQYGSVKISLAEEGSVYVDGVHVGTIGAGRSATLSDITVGNHQIDVRYGSHSEQKSVRVTENGTARAVFSWKPPVETPQQYEDLVFVRGGTFQMGNANGDTNELPVHSVTLRDFYISQYEVTQGEYRAVMGSNPSDTDTGIGDNYPVNNMTWYKAVEFCNALSRKEGLSPCYSGSGDSTTCDFSANGYRLPTEAEWEYAARGGGSSLNYTYAGSNSLDSVGWYKENSGGKCHPIGQKQVNELGLYDMTGNVFEWIWDWYDTKYVPGSKNNPTGMPSGERRAYRGGSWRFEANYCRATDRCATAPSNAYNNIGIRVVRSR